LILKNQIIRGSRKYDHSRIFVSYCVPTCLYGLTRPEVGAGYYSKYRADTQITKIDQIVVPSRRYVFIETGEERNYKAMGWWIFGAPEFTGNREWAWWDCLAINHGDSSNIGFADGHSEKRKWVDPFTRERVYKLSKQEVPVYGIEYPPSGQTEDINYMANGWPRRPRASDY